nr:MAG TPA: hypothetical protein [Caudoviricetes sp.]
MICTKSKKMVNTDCRKSNTRKSKHLKESI